MSGVLHKCKHEHAHLLTACIHTRTLLRTLTRSANKYYVLVSPYEKPFWWWNMVGTARQLVLVYCITLEESPGLCLCCIILEERVCVFLYVYLCVCVCACVFACVPVCVSVCVCAESLLRRALVCV